MPAHEHGGMSVSMEMLEELQTTLKALADTGADVKQIEVAGHLIRLTRHDIQGVSTGQVGQPRYAYEIIGITGIKPKDAAIVIREQHPGYPPPVGSGRR